MLSLILRNLPDFVLPGLNLAGHDLPFICHFLPAGRSVLNLWACYRSFTRLMLNRNNRFRDKILPLQDDYGGNNIKTSFIEC